MYPIATAGAWNENPADRPWWAEFDVSWPDERLQAWADGFVFAIATTRPGGKPCWEMDEEHGRKWVLVHTGETSDGKACRYLPADIMNSFRATVIEPTPEEIRQREEQEWHDEA